MFATVPVREVWVVGSRISKRLDSLGIKTVLELRRADPKRMRSFFSVVMERTVSELNGESCLALEDIAPPKKQIISSRSFGAEVHSL